MTNKIEAPINFYGTQNRTNLENLTTSNIQADLSKEIILRFPRQR